MSKSPGAGDRGRVGQAMMLDTTNVGKPSSAGKRRRRKQTSGWERRIMRPSTAAVCPHCKAKPGKPCRWAGKPRTPHRERFEQHRKDRTIQSVRDDGVIVVAPGGRAARRSSP